MAFGKTLAVLLVGFIGGCLLCDFDIGTKCKLSTDEEDDDILQDCFETVLKVNVTEDPAGVSRNMTKMQIIDVGMCTAKYFGVIEEGDNEVNSTLAKEFFSSSIEDMDATDEVKNNILTSLEKCTDTMGNSTAFLVCGMDAFEEHCS